MFQNKNSSQKDVVQAVVIGDIFNDEFKPITDDTPFMLMPLVNVPLLEYTLEFLSLGGVEETFLFCCKGSKEIKQYLEDSIQGFARWSLSMKVTPISSETCRSFGDCMRDLDAKGIIRGNFILVDPGTVGNIKLLKYFKRHKETLKRDINAAITLLFQEAGAGSHGSTVKDEINLVVDKTNRILHYQYGILQNMRKMEIPIEIINTNSVINVFHNLKDMHVAICSPCVLSLFSDNFDFQTRDDFIRGVLMNEEILGSTMYLQNVKGNQYGDAVSSWRKYQSISNDIINRWLYPRTPDVTVLEAHTTYLHGTNNIYKPQDVQIGRNVNLVEDVVIGSKSTICDGTRIKCSVIGENVYIGKDTSVENSFVFPNVVIENNVKLNYAIIGADCILKEKCSVALGSILGTEVVLPKGTKVENVLVQAKPPKNYDPNDKISNNAYKIKPEEDDFSESGKDTYCRSTTRLCWDDPESDISEEDPSSEESEDLSYRNSPAPDDTNLFLTEVMDSLARGYEDKLQCDNLILEINSSRYAYNVTLREVNLNVVKAILELPFQQLPYHQSTGVQYLNFLRPLLKYYRPIIKNYIRNEDAMVDALQAVEEVGGSNSEIMDCVVKILEWFYDNDFITEEAILNWYNNLEPSSKLHNKVEPLITWLQEAEEASDDEEEEEEEEE